MSQAARQHKLHHALLDALLRAQRTGRRRALWPRLRPLGRQGHGRQGEHQRRRELLEPGRKTDLVRVRVRVGVRDKDRVRVRVRVSRASRRARRWPRPRTRRRR